MGALMSHVIRLEVCTALRRGQSRHWRTWHSSRSSMDIQIPCAAELNLRRLFERSIEDYNHWTSAGTPFGLCRMHSTATAIRAQTDQSGSRRSETTLLWRALGGSRSSAYKAHGGVGSARIQSHGRSHGATASRQRARTIAARSNQSYHSQSRSKTAYSRGASAR